MTTQIHHFVEQARALQNPYVICKLPSGWVVLGNKQFLRGYCLLLPDPVCQDLNALSKTERMQFLYDMSLIGDALHQVTDACRINYEILGNLEPALHAHIIPRYSYEEEKYRTNSPRSYDWQNAEEINIKDYAELKVKIANAIIQLNS
jgi:diadenosine tetraphosphate (Ap4A) HIT family hydrolase